MSRNFHPLKIHIVRILPRTSSRIGRFHSAIPMERFPIKPVRMIKSGMKIILNVHRQLVRRDQFLLIFQINQQIFIPIDSNQTLQIIPNLPSINVELGRIYTLLCRSNDPRFEPEWVYENGTVISSSMFSIPQ